MNIYTAFHFNTQSFKIYRTYLKRQMWRLKYGNIFHPVLYRMFKWGILVYRLYYLSTTRTIHIFLWFYVTFQRRLNMGIRSFVDVWSYVLKIVFLIFNLWKFLGNNVNVFFWNWNNFHDLFAHFVWCRNKIFRSKQKRGMYEWSHHISIC